jgi:hypothetical protein
LLHKEYDELVTDLPRSAGELFNYTTKPGGKTANGRALWPKMGAGSLSGGFIKGRAAAQRYFAWLLQAVGKFPAFQV